MYLFLCSAESMPIWIGFLENLSTLKWVFYAYSVNEYTGLKFDCDDVQDANGCLETGEEVLELLSFDKLGVETPALILLGILVTFHLIAYFCLSLNVEQYMECERPPQSMTIDVGDGAELEINGTTTNGQNAEK